METSIFLGPEFLESAMYTYVDCSCLDIRAVGGENCTRPPREFPSRGAAHHRSDTKDVHFRGSTLWHQSMTVSPRLARIKICNLFKADAHGLSKAAAISPDCV